MALTKAQRDKRDGLLRRFHESTGGAFSLSFIREANVVDVLVASLEGDRDARRLMQAIAQWFQQVGQGDGASCMACNRDITGTLPRLVAVALADDEAAPAIVAGYCDACSSRSLDAIQADTLAILREVWPKLRVIPERDIHRRAGTA